LNDREEIQAALRQMVPYFLGNDAYIFAQMVDCDQTKSEHCILRLFSALEVLGESFEMNWGDSGVTPFLTIICDEILDSKRNLVINIPLIISLPTYTEDYKDATKRYKKDLRNPMVSFKKLGDSYIYLIGLAKYLQNGISGCKDEIKVPSYVQR
jgi:hypothetical protein